MEKCDVRLLGMWASPFVIRARIALNLKSIAHQYLEENLRSKSELLLQSNPVCKKVPVLLHNGRAICESLIIVQYIDESWPGSAPLISSDPYDRAISRFWAAYIDDRWYPSSVGIVKASTAEEKAAAVKQTMLGLGLMEEALVKCGKGKVFFAGDAPGYLDVALGCFIAWMRAAERMMGLVLLDEKTTPCLVRWADRFSALESVKPVMPDIDKLVEFAQMWRDRTAVTPPN